MRVRDQKSLLSGLLFTVIGTVFAFAAQQYSMGTAAEMGAGYFPAMLSIALAIVGIIIATKSVSRSPGTQIALPVFHWKPTLIILASVAFFAVSLRLFGLVATTIGTVLIARLAIRPMFSLNSVLTALCLAAFTAAVFRFGLDLPLPLWPTFDFR